MGEFDTCVSENCCDALKACTYDYSDAAGCYDCLENGGLRCEALFPCFVDICGAVIWTCVRVVLPREGVAYAEGG